MTVLDIPTPLAFEPLFAPRQFKGAKGGRGGAKSHFFAGLLVEEMFMQHTRAVCAREVQHSIKDSVKQLLEDKVNKYGLASKFRITEREIVCPSTDSVAIFRGLQKRTANSIKSLEGYTRALYEEAQSLSQGSIDLAINTIRKTGSEQWFAWNPDKDTDPVDSMFLKAEAEKDPDFVCVTVNYPDNPWFPDELRKNMERDRKRDPDKYSHIWLGQYRRNSEARVFKNWKVEAFPTPENTTFYFGADWGFSNDPTVLIRCFVVSRTMFIDRCVWKIGCEIDRTPALFDKIPNSRKWTITADSARPETISYMQRNGFPRMKAAIKGPGSVVDGIEFLKSYDIVVHPDCVDPVTGINHVADELTHFSYVIDPKTQEVTNILEDKKNHTIDSIRYALEAVRRRNVVTNEPMNF